MSSPERTVAVLGTGHMGGAMVGTLRRAGHPVRAWNRTAARAEAVAGPAGAEVAPTPRRAVEAAGVVLSSLADDEAVRDAYTGEGGAVEGLSEGQVVLEMSTISPRTVHWLAPQVLERGATLLDAPVSGSVPVVERGELTIMVGGDGDALERARPVLDALASKVLRVGDLGAGATMKLAVNALIHAIDVGLSEALVLAERAGVERGTAYDVFAGGAAGAPFVQYKRPNFEHPDDAPVTFRMDLMAKDLELILALARDVGAPVDQVERNREIVLAAVAAGYGDRDLSAVAAFLRERAKQGG